MSNTICPLFVISHRIELPVECIGERCAWYTSICKSKSEFGIVENGFVPKMRKEGNGEDKT